jgi:hypothetical protein
LHGKGHHGLSVEQIIEQLDALMHTGRIDDRGLAALTKLREIQKVQEALF